MASRRHHRYPTCSATGLVRFGELKDARLALRNASRQRASAGSRNETCRRQEVRAFRCPSCHGYHLTTQAQRSRPHGVLMLG